MSEANKHTPGPWQVNNGASTRSIAFSGSAGFDLVPWGNLQPITDADARLIAAAPDLLAALERLESISACQHWGACNGRAPNGINTKPLPMTEACPACQARAAIAGARGTNNNQEEE